LQSGHFGFDSKTKLHEMASKSSLGFTNNGFTLGEIPPKVENPEEQKGDSSY